MARTPNIDTEKLKAQSLQLRDAAAVHAGRIAVRAADLAEQGLDWAAPRAQAALASAIERATPLVESATDRTLGICKGPDDSGSQEVLQEVPSSARPVLHRCCRSSSRRRLRPVEAQPADRRSLGRGLLGRPGS